MYHHPKQTSDARQWRCQQLLVFINCACWHAIASASGVSLGDVALAHMLTGRSSRRSEASSHACPRRQRWRTRGQQHHGLLSSSSMTMSP